jgi:hypothetical protein
MRMICDTNYILDREDRTSPKIDELESVLQSCQSRKSKSCSFPNGNECSNSLGTSCSACASGTPGTRAMCRRSGAGRKSTYSKAIPQCRVFLSTDSGRVGLNLQNASIVINCDLPWNPVKLEQLACILLARPLVAHWPILESDKRDAYPPILLTGLRSHPTEHRRAAYGLAG